MSTEVGIAGGFAVRIGGKERAVWRCTRAGGAGGDLLKILRSFGLALVVGGCGPADDVRVLPLPPLEQPSLEARLGLPELEGAWRFVGWEIVAGDSTALERTFPSFGDLTISGQRLDSIAGTFSLASGPAPVVGEVRRDGWVALVTLDAGTPTAYVTGRLVRDTLWLELASVMPQDEWPRDSHAAFVRDGALSERVAWLRGYGPGTPRPQPMDMLAGDTSTAAGAAGALPGIAGQTGTGGPAASGGVMSQPASPPTDARPPATGGAAVPPPAPPAAPDPRAPADPPPARPQPPADDTPPDPGDDPDDAPPPAPPPAPAPPPPGPPPLLGDPVPPRQ